MLAALAFQLSIQSWLGNTVFLLIYPAVFLTVWLLGTGPGILATLLGSIAAITFFEPDFDFFSPSKHQLLPILTFIIVGSALAFLIGKGRAAEARLRESEKRFRLLVLALTHDLKTPLTVAKSSAELILRNPDRADARQKVLPRVLSSLERLETMIQDILDANQVETGQALPLVLRESDLNLELANTVDELRIAHGDRLKLETKGNLGGFYDPDAIKRCVENLVSNAVKYGASETEITVSATESPSGIRIEVHNEGAPIPESEKRYLFDAYRRAEGAATSGIRGWGIGLTLVKGLVEAHQGRIRVESRKDHGTSFIIELPKLSQKSIAA